VLLAVDAFNKLYDLSEYKDENMRCAIPGALLRLPLTALCAAGASLPSACRCASA
jgi:hypothetical protein